MARTPRSLRASVADVLMELPAPPRSPAVGLHAGCLRVLFYRRLTDKWALGARRAAKEPLHWRRWRVKSAIRGPVCLSVCQAACLSVCQRVTDLPARSLAFAALLFSPPTSLVSLTGANVSVPLKSVHSSEFDGRVYLFFFPLRQTKAVPRQKGKAEKKRNGCLWLHWKIDREAAAEAVSQRARNPGCLCLQPEEGKQRQQL